MKVLHVFKSYFPETVGGIEQVIYQLAQAGNKHNIQSDILTLHEGKTQTFRFNKQIVFAVHRDLQLASTGFSIQAFAVFKRIINKYDIIHYHYPWPFGDLLHLFLGRNKPSILTYHSDIVRQQALEKVYRPVQQRFLRSMDRIVVTSPNYLRSSSTLVPFHDKTAVIPIGLNKDSYPAPPLQKLKQRKEQFGEDFFLFVGVLRYYKGLHILLDAIKGTNLKVVIAGSGPTEQELKEEAREYNLDNVFFVGHISEEDKAALLTLCKAVVFPSHLRSEAFGISLLEGAMYGKPMISCEIGTGTTFINEANVTGIVVPPSDPNALRQAMQRLISDEAGCARMGESAFNRYEKLFTDKAMLSGYEKIYRELTQHKPSHT
ncbi:MAG: glycosyltransferase [Pseudoalteromonas sp.]|nr:glycosyltransferase [Pseudoalteromonas sp.]